MILLLEDNDGGLEKYIESLPLIRQQKIDETTESIRELIDADEIAAEYALALIVLERTGICLFGGGPGFTGH